MSAGVEAEAMVRTRLPGNRALSNGKSLYWWGETLGVVLFYAVYSTVRNATNKGASGASAAFSHARGLIHVERAMGIFHEESVQEIALHFKPLLIASNYFYGSLHFIVTIGAAIFLYRRFTDDYPLWRNTLGASTALALIGFATFPLMPPRLLPPSYGFVDTLARYPTLWSFNSGAVSRISNQFAAMPSVHCAWALWCACLLAPRVRTRWARGLAIAYPAGTVTVIVLTANHYFLDAVGGFAILGAGYLIARRFTPRVAARPAPR